MHWLDVAVHEGDKILVTPHIFNNTHKLRQKMKKIILSILGTSLFLGSYAQNPSENTEHRLVYSWWGGKFHIVDEHGYRVKTNLKKSAMIGIMQQTPNGVEMYNDYRRTVKTNTILTTSAAVTAVAGLGFVFAGIDWQNEDIRPGLFWTGVGLEGATIVLAATAIPFGFIAKNKGKKVASYHNSVTGRNTLNFGTTRHGIGLTYNF